MLERIFIHKNRLSGKWNPQPWTQYRFNDEDIEYIRADIHEAEIAKLKATGERLAGMLYSASFHLTSDDCVIINNAIAKWQEATND